MTALGTHRRTAESVTGVQLAQGLGVREAKGFWADAWSQVLRRPGAVAGLCWIAVLAFFAIAAPLLASGHPWILRELNEAGEVVRVSSPLIERLGAVDILLIVGSFAGALWLALPIPIKRSDRLLILVMAALQTGLTVIVAQAAAAAAADRDASDWLRALEQKAWFVPAASAAAAFLCALPFLIVPTRERLWERAIIVALVALVAGLVVSQRWTHQLDRFDYLRLEAAGSITANYAPVPWSPTQSDTALFLKPPGTTLGDVIGEEAGPGADRAFLLGTDSLGQDVLSQMLHAARLSISIGLVSTGIAVTIGVTLGALAGYFGGWVDLLVSRIIEVFMAIPVLFLLIVAAGVLPRNTYVMMAIIGFFTWPTAARFTRAEFFKLRGQDFVQSARAVGLPLRSILFRQMLPNGVTPVLVDASFLIAAAIIIEATLSYLGLGPDGQPSWGKLLASATGQTGTFIWWLAVFPGLAIFLTVLSLTLIGEALRDAIDPRLKKARV